MLRGNVSSLKRFSEGLKDLPRVVAAKVAEAAAPAITALALETFDARTDPYGVPWIPGVDGEQITLDKTGAMKRQIRYVAIGSKLRVALGVPYAKFQISKRPIFPKQAGALPVDYIETLSESASDAIREGLGT